MAKKAKEPVLKIDIRHSKIMHHTDTAFLFARVFQHSTRELQLHKKPQNKRTFKSLWAIDMKRDKCEDRVNYLSASRTFFTADKRWVVLLLLLLTGLDLRLNILAEDSRPDSFSGSWSVIDKLNLHQWKCRSLPPIEAVAQLLFQWTSPMVMWSTFHMEHSLACDRDRCYWMDMR